MLYPVSILKALGWLLTACFTPHSRGVVAPKGARVGGASFHSEGQAAWRTPHRFLESCISRLGRVGTATVTGPHIDPRLAGLPSFSQACHSRTRLMAGFPFVTRAVVVQKLVTSRNVMMASVAGAGFEPATFGL